VSTQLNFADLTQADWKMKNRIRPTQSETPKKEIPECFCVFFKRQKRAGFYMTYPLLEELYFIMKDYMMESPLCVRESTRLLFRELEEGVLHAVNSLPYEETGRRVLSQIINEDRRAEAALAKQTP
jgi:hypothetical protein